MPYKKVEKEGFARKLTDNEAEFTFDEYGNIRYRDLKTGQFISEKRWKEILNGSEHEWFKKLK